MAKMSTEMESSPSTPPTPDHSTGPTRPKVISLTEDGKLGLLPLKNVVEILENADSADDVVADIFREAARYQDNVESFQIWLSSVWDVVMDNEFWKGKHTIFAEWIKESQNETCKNIAREGRKLRNKKDEAIKGLMMLGASGPRFQYLIGTESRSLLQAVRQQMSNHGISYPLTVALANIRAYHRIAPGTPGKRGVQRTPCTQTCDIANLDVVGYREITAQEMAAAQVKIGPHGFLVAKDAKPIFVRDVEFDRAMASFELGKRAAEQPSPYAKAEPPQEELERNVKNETKNLEKLVCARPSSFGFVTECSCATTVSAQLKTALDQLHWSSGYEVIEPLLDDISEARHDLCIRHCQLWLVCGLGVERLKRKTDREYLVKEMSERMYRLKVQVNRQPDTKEGFSSMKKGLAFSWEDVKDIKIPKQQLGKRGFSD